MIKLSLDELHNLPGHISKENIETLQKYLNEGTVVDVGTCVGKSAIVMANEGAHVLTCDPLPNPEAKNKIEGFDIEMFVETSEDFGKNHCPDVIDGCFIDGVHNYDGVKTDIENIASKVKVGGYILFHDLNLYPNTIPAAVKEFEGSLYQFVEEVGGNDGTNGEPREGSMWVGRRI